MNLGHQVPGHSRAARDRRGGTRAEEPRQLLRRKTKSRPDVIVKGGDYTTATVVGAEDVMSWGGKVEIVPIVPGHSTSGIIARMNIPSSPENATTS